MQVIFIRSKNRSSQEQTFFITQAESKTGTAKTNMAVAILVPAITASAAKEKPINIEPEVPARTRAGLKLKTRKPKTAPAKMAARIAIGGWYTSDLSERKK